MLVKSRIDAGGALAETGKSVGEDLLSSAKMDMFPMPHTCSTFGIADDPSILTAIRLRADDVGVDAEVLDELAKSEDPRSSLRRLLGLPPSPK